MMHAAEIQRFQAGPDDGLVHLRQVSPLPVTIA
jgi:hypothetical protein